METKGICAYTPIDIYIYIYTEREIEKYRSVQYEYAYERIARGAKTRTIIVFSSSLLHSGSFASTASKLGWLH